MAVKTFTPRCKILLSKNIEYGPDVSARKSSTTEIDITPFLGDAGEVTVAKSIYSPMGSFVIQVPDKPMPLIDVPGDLAGRHGGDTLYGLIEPMDYVEIRMARFPTAGGDLPIVMRGFVREVMRSEVMGPGGRPRRVVVVSGNDFGLLFSNYQITSLEGLIKGDAMMLSYYQMAQRLGLHLDTVPISEFYQRIVDDIINPYLAKIAAAPLGDIKVDSSVTAFGMYLNAVDPMDKSIWNLMLREADTHFNELFIEDRDDGVYLVYRPVPWRDLKGAYIPQRGQKVETGVIEQHIRDVISLTASRDDFEVANQYFVKPTIGALFDYTQLLQTMHSGEVIVDDHRNCDPLLYGARRNEISIRQVPLAYESPNTDKPEAVHQRNETNMVEFAKERLKTFKELNWDNAVFEHGTIAFRGDETVKPGNYIRLTRGQLRPEYYAYAVTHRFAPFRQFVTVAQFVRGTGYVERIKLEGQPNLLEAKGGVYLNDTEWLNWISGFR